jgi:hypothetical protein
MNRNVGNLDCVIGVAVNQVKNIAFRLIASEESFEQPSYHFFCITYIHSLISPTD